jgi:hypothetical protein
MKPSSTKSSDRSRKSGAAKAGPSARKPSARRKPVPPSEGLFGVPGLLPHERGNSVNAEVPAYPGAISGQDVDHDAQHQANQRHLEESNLTAIHGHIASSDRRNQGKRDNRGGDTE